MTRDDQDRLAAEHVLGLLEGEERGLAERLLTSDESFQALVQQWHTRFAEWDNTAVNFPPSDALWQRIDTGLEAQPAVAAARPVASARRETSPSLLQGLWNSLAFWRGFGMAGALAALLLTVGVSYFADKATRQPTLVAVLMSETNQPGAVLRTFADGRLELTPLGDMEIPHNHSIQVWTFPDPNGAPVSVGVVQTARTVLLDPRNLPQPHSNQLFAISVEPLTGSPTGLPTGPVVMKGTASTAL
ncbi:anti-sigma factor [Microvirga sp. CF3062]|uniref:anti-sigma factor n=1 Tax=Microvirga sp. CF3062 TaxID=3110182 RepID=UPI002E7964EA|nr:anti-sigma factor [Microvirga sp. CF3062]MEE1657944.1 anti-sigma factor [Microvirga sp. CF3062]